MLSNPVGLMQLQALSNQGQQPPPQGQPGGLAAEIKPPVPAPPPVQSPLAAMATKTLPPLAASAPPKPIQAPPVPQTSAPKGFIPSSVAGRTDAIPAKVQSDSYVIPADVISGLGQGNSLSGAKLLDEIFSLFGNVTGGGGYKKGGHVKKQHLPPEPTDVIVAGGEYIVPPNVVQAIGEGDMNKGHQALDMMVKNIRAHTLKRMAKLPAPKKD